MQSVLIIEDDKSLADNLKKFLETEGYSVKCAQGQKSGLSLFNSENFCCVLLDLSIADGNGFSVCAKIRESSRTPIIFLTASSDEVCTVAGFEAGADDYITKPFRPKELAARIKNALRRKTPEPLVYKCRNVTADTQRALVTKNGNEIFLSALEYRLILLFFSNKGKLLTRDRIAEELWNISGEYIGDNTLNVYIKRLRNKIEDDPQNPRILKTVRGLGYKAVDE